MTPPARPSALGHMLPLWWRHLLRVTQSQALIGWEACVGALATCGLGAHPPPQQVESQAWGSCGAWLWAHSGSSLHSECVEMVFAQP